MKKHCLIVLSILFILAMPQILLAGANTHYTNGIEGIKGGSVPPPGVYYKMYNVMYTADDSKDVNGNNQNIGFELDVFAVANRFIWVTHKKFLGGDFFMDATIPLIYTDISIAAANISDDEFGLGDICIEPLGLAWHGQMFDAAVSQAFYLPTGSYDPLEPASPGKGFYTSMTTVGGTLFLDQAKSWSFSVLARYEIHSDQEDKDFTPGDDFHFEWGLGKAFAKTWEAGIAGYCQWQVSDDSGTDALNPNVHDQVYAAGPEISVFIPKFKIFLSLRSLFEFEAQDRPEGNTTVLTLTKIF
ncbi:MAG: transporter [Desulfobacter sp.]|nr:transporter [Desulfobacter sp.]WDP86722.1 MAG: transporter [Desulfobacter sp.]